MPPFKFFYRVLIPANTPERVPGEIMVKHLIVIHGRSIKPAEAKMRTQVLRAVKEGIIRSGDPACADKLDTAALKFSFVYYGDFNNRIQKKDRNDKAAMTDVDPDHGDGPALPDELIEMAMDLSLQKSPRFTKAAYRKVLADAKDSRFMDEIASVFSFFGALGSAGILNEKLIEFAKPDMGKYLRSHATGSAIRQRLQKVLVPAILAGDDIMLISHSMGCMVAWDVFWKFTHNSEYAHVRAVDNSVRKWITIGCPLAEKGVRKNLLDGHYSEEDRYPREMFDDWHNFWAEDDFISHKSSMRKGFGRMKTRGFVNSIRDRKIYNCWVYKKSGSDDLYSNPHDLYGYLAHHLIGAQISEWA